MMPVPAQVHGSLTVGSIPWTRQLTTKATYEALLEFLARGHNPNRRTFKMRSTIVEKEGEKIDIWYHETPILSFWKDRFKINSGGWRTMSTKERINEFLPGEFRITQKDSVWYLNGLPYYDGMIVRRDKIGSRSTLKSKEELTRIGKTKRQVKEYLKKLETMIDKKELQDPGSGDCWLCVVNTDPRHIQGHLDEMYVVPTLVYNAIQDNGGDAQFLWSWYKGSSNSPFKFHAVNAVRRWFYRNLGIGR
jgi:hypothetical protein